MSRAHQRLLAVAMLVVALSPSTIAVTLVRDGVAEAEIQLPERNSPSSRFAAEELARYVEQMSDATLPIRSRGEALTMRSFVRLEISKELGSEAWEIDVRRRQVTVRGGDDRGLIYAVYHLLEDRLGVRWWTPWDEEVPVASTIRIGGGKTGGRPQFRYRDLFGVRGYPLFHLRLRLNGHYAALSPDRGGSVRFGPPFHVHTFDRLLPAQRHFDMHPEWYSMRGGLRIGDKTQWCLSEPTLFDAAESAVRRQIERGRTEASRSDQSAPVIFDVSPNDWRNHCECDRCIEAVEAHGGRGAHLADFVSRLSMRLADVDPPIKLMTLAYHQTFLPSPLPASESNGGVVVRIADLYERDFSKRLGATQNASVDRAIAGWSERFSDLHYWDYRVTFGPGGDLPRADHAWIADRYRRLAALGVDGIFVQTEFADVADMRDLEVWLVAKLLENPRQSGRRLTRQFLKGYYGAAWRPIQRYLRRIERDVAAQDVRLNFAPEPHDYSWLTPTLLRWAHEQFDEAERRVAASQPLVDRVRGARLALDRATLALWPTAAFADKNLEAIGYQAVANRYGEVRRERIERRLTGAQAELALESLANELARVEQAE